MSKKKIQINIDKEELRKKLDIKDGKDGKDGITPIIDVKNIAVEASTMAQDALKHLIPTITQLEELKPNGTKIRNELETLNGDERLKIEAVKNLREELDVIKRTGGEHIVSTSNRGLYQLLDVNVSGVTNNQSIKWDGSQWIPYTPVDLDQQDLQDVTDIGATTTHEILGVDPTTAPALATKRYVDALAGGGMKSWFFTKTASDIAGMYKATTTLPPGGIQTITATAVKNTETVIAEFLTELQINEYRVTEGSRFFYITANTDNDHLDLTLIGRIYTTDIDGLNPVLLRTSTYSIPLTEIPASLSMNAWGGSLLIPTTTRVKFVISALNIHNQNHPVTLSVEDDTFSRLDVPSPVGVTDISGKLNIDQTTPQTTVGNFSFPSVSVTAGNMNQYSPMLFGDFSDTSGYIPIWNDGVGGFDSDSGMYYSVAIRQFQTSSIYAGNGVTNVTLNDGTYAINTTGNSLFTGNASITGTLTTPTINGGILANDDITIQGTTHATRTTSYVNLQPNGGKVGIGTATPTYQLQITDSDTATGGILVNTSSYINIPNPGSVTEKAIFNARGFGFCVDTYTLGATFQPTLGIGLAGNRGPMLGIKASATGAAIAIEQGRIGVGTAGPETPIDSIGNIQTRSTSATAYETRTRMVSTYYGGASNYASGGLEIDGVQAAVGYGLYGATRFYAGANTDATRGWAWKADGLLLTTTLALSTAQMVLNKAGNLGIGTIAPAVKLHVVGGNIRSVTTVTDTYIVLATDYTVVCNKATAFAVTLPPATATIVGQIYNIKNINTGVVTVTADTTGTADTIDGNATQAVYQWENVKIQCTAADKWSIL